MRLQDTCSDDQLHRLIVIFAHPRLRGLGGEENFQYLHSRAVVSCLTPPSWLDCRRKSPARMGGSSRTRCSGVQYLLKCFIACACQSQSNRGKNEPPTVQYCTHRHRVPGTAVYPVPVLYRGRGRAGAARYTFYCCVPRPRGQHGTRYPGTRVQWYPGCIIPKTVCHLIDQEEAVAKSPIQNTTAPIYYCTVLYLRVISPRVARVCIAVPG